MINQLLNPYHYTATEQNCIALAANNWDSGRNCIKELKVNLNRHFNTSQNEKCCYCGLYYDRTGRGELEHIAPKGAEYYPEFTYTAKNLAKACQLCNSSSMKHTFDSIIRPQPLNYDLCDFKIVHPYFDDHNFHYSWKFGTLRVAISINNNSEKAKESIKLFELDSEARTKARAQQRNQERIELFYNIPHAVKERIMQVIRHT